MENNENNRSSCEVRIDRSVYHHEQLRNDFEYEKARSKGLTTSCSDVNKKNVKDVILTTIPLLRWLPKYKWKTDFISDVIAGITVAVMHIPQGMAYGLLGNVPPVTGIYMAFFPVLIYFIFGTSRHNSMGTFAIVGLMTGKVVLEHSDPSFFLKKSFDSLNTTEEAIIQPLNQFYSPTQVASAVTLTVALFQLCMYVLRLGAVSALLSETLVSGFTTGAAFQVVSSQIKDLLGLNIPRQKGFFVVIKTLQSVFENISTVNYAALVLSGVSIIAMMFNNEVLKPIVAKKSSFPIPIELIAMIIGTLVAKYLDLHEIYGIKTLGHIPKGIPEPELAPVSLITSILFDGFAIAVVSYSISLSMALIFAQKMNYEINANQELFAQGVGNIFGSFFGCMPFAASLSRTVIQQATGGKTQIASIVSCGLLLIVLLWIGPFFESLPRSVLASVIVVALKGLLMQVKDFFKFLKLSKMDALVWLVTFLTVVFISVDIGIFAGVLMSLITIFVPTFKPHTCLLGSVPYTDIFVDISTYKRAEEIPGIKIYHYSGSLNFATRNIFWTDLLKLVDINPQKEAKYRKKLADFPDIAKSESDSKKIAKLKRKINDELKVIILDFSCISYIDPSGISTIQNVIDVFKKIEIQIYIAGCSEPVFEMMCKCGLISKNKGSVFTFPTLHDAVTSALAQENDGPEAIPCC